MLVYACKVDANDAFFNYVPTLTWIKISLRILRYQGVDRFLEVAPKFRHSQVVSSVFPLQWTFKYLVSSLPEVPLVSPSAVNGKVWDLTPIIGDVRPAVTGARSVVASLNSGIMGQN